MQNRRLAILYSLGAMLCLSLGMVLIRVGARTFSISIDTLLPIIFGFSLFVLGFLLLSSAFRYGDLSLVHPLLSTGYILTFLIGVLFLNESITIFKSVGLLFLITGAILLAVKR